MDETCEMPGVNVTSKEIEEILNSIKTIAIVGMSPKHDRESNHVAKYLMAKGYKIIPVNPTYDKILGRRSYASVLEIPEEIDAVDIFRKSEAVPEIVNDAIKKGTKVIWMQEGIINNDAAKTACEANMKVVMNRCMKKEHYKLTMAKQKQS
jgi:predicted CoA-binding protein